MKKNGIETLYLITNHTSFYERYGWEYLCMVQGNEELYKITRKAKHGDSIEIKDDRFYPVFVHAKKIYATNDCISCGKCAKVYPLTLQIH